MKKAFRILLIAFAALMVFGLYVDSFGRFTLEEMDWNRDGQTSLGEIWRAGN
jgi:hypothetical protein